MFVSKPFKKKPNIFSWKNIMWSTFYFRRPSGRYKLYLRRVKIEDFIAILILNWSNLDKVAPERCDFWGWFCLKSKNTDVNAVSDTVLLLCSIQNYWIWFINPEETLSQNHYFFLAAYGQKILRHHWSYPPTHPQISCHHSHHVIFMIFPL